jgi:hypothetical protein
LRTAPVPPLLSLVLLLLPVLSAVIFSVYPFLHPLHYEGTLIPVLAPEM